MGFAMRLDNSSLWGVGAGMASDRPAELSITAGDRGSQPRSTARRGRRAHVDAAIRLVWRNGQAINVGQRTDHDRDGPRKGALTRMIHLNGLSVLVVEDDPDARELMQAVLEQRGAVVRSADGVARAFELLADGLPDIIVSDIAMPEEDGVAFLTRLRAMPEELGGSLPAVAVSAYTAASDRARALKAGFDQYLFKPVDFDELCMTMRKLLDRRSKASA